MIKYEDITLDKTCGACPEQYDAYEKCGDKTIGYLRLRHGGFTVECPDVGGDLVYQGYPEGDGAFYEHEREFYLTKAKLAICEYYMHNDLLVSDVEDKNKNKKEK